jgi:hypothetical protein
MNTNSGMTPDQLAAAGILIDFLTGEELAIKLFGELDRQ